MLTNCGFEGLWGTGREGYFRDRKWKRNACGTASGGCQ